jgi:hypothetical protein
MPTVQILVIAPDSDLRRSLRFALEAERFAVAWRAGIGATLSPGAYDCTIIDHDALGSDVAAARAFVRTFAPVILLANRPHELSSEVFRTLLKPGLGAPLIAAVHEALARAGRS